MEKRFVEVLGHRMAYVEAGSGRPIVLLHGNPTSSYLWRNVIPHLSGLGRCLAPDLIGMGDSDKLDHSSAARYTLREHQEFVDGFLDAAGVTAVRRRDPGHPRLGWGPRVRLGPPPPRSGRRDRLHGDDRPAR